MLLLPLMGWGQVEIFGNIKDHPHLESIYKEMYQDMYKTMKINPVLPKTHFIDVSYSDDKGTQTRQFYVTEFEVYPGNNLIDIQPAQPVSPVFDYGGYLQNYLGTKPNH